jgi:hypothetical protein
MHAYDRALLRRTLVLTLVAGVIALAVAVATDEAASTWRMRVARMSAFTPALAALGASVVLGQARARGELRALAALGYSPWRAALGPMLAGWLYGLAACAAVLSPWSDARALFPSVPTPATWWWDGTALTDLAHGVHVKPTGELLLRPGRPAQWAGFVPTRQVAALALGPLAMVTPAWVGTPIRLAPRAAGIVATAALAVALLHAVAAGQLRPGWLVLSAVPLAVQTLFGLKYR